MSVLNSKNMIAEAVERDYDGSGYVACVSGDIAAIGSVGHCSCYGTWHYESGEPDGCTEIWSGKLADLLEMASRNGDPNMPGRVLTAEDFDFAKLTDLYSIIRTWNAAQGAGNFSI